MGKSVCLEHQLETNEHYHNDISLARVGNGGTGCRPHLRCQYAQERTSKTPGGACSKTSLNSSLPTIPCRAFKSSGVPKVITCARKCTGSASSSSGVLNHTTRRATFKMSGVMGKGFMMSFRFRLSAWRKVVSNLLIKMRFIINNYNRHPNSKG